MRKGLVIAAAVIVAIVLSASFLVAYNYQFLTETSSKTTAALAECSSLCGSNILWE